jgi:hypothetical protein
VRLVRSRAREFDIRDRGDGFVRGRPSRVDGGNALRRPRGEDRSPTRRHQRATLRRRLSRDHDEGALRFQAFKLPPLSVEGGLCYTGKESARLILSEAAIDELLSAISETPMSEIQSRSKAALTNLLAPNDLLEVLECGLELSLAADAKPPIMVSVTGAECGAPGRVSVWSIEIHPLGRSPRRWKSVAP